MIDQVIRDRYMRTKETRMRDVLLSAGECNTWLTVSEIAQLAGRKVKSVQTRLYRLQKSFPGVYLVIRKCKRRGCLREYQLRKVSES